MKGASWVKWEQPPGQVFPIAPFRKNEEKSEERSKGLSIRCSLDRHFWIFILDGASCNSCLGNEETIDFNCPEAIILLDQS